MVYQEDLELIAKMESDEIRIKKKQQEWETKKSFVRQKAIEKEGIRLQDGSYL